MSSNEKFDLIIIGSGPSGVHASIQAAKLGKKVLIIEKHPSKIGGAWLHTGTVPSKAVREIVDSIYALSRHVGEHWVKRIQNSFSISDVLSKAKRSGSEEENIIKEFIAQNNIVVMHGRGQIESENSVRIIGSEGDNKIVYGDYIFIATGSRPRRPDYVPFDGWRIIDSDDVLNLDYLPSEMIIMGAGVIGCEYACIFQNLGGQVTLVDTRDTVLGYVDEQVVGELINSMKARGVKIILGKNIDKIEIQNEHVKVKLKNVLNINANRENRANDLELTTDLLFYAAGRNPNTDNLGLERVGIELGERKHILVDENFKTRIPTIYAGGDVIGVPALAATSTKQGRHAALQMFRQTCQKFPSLYPIGIYTIPECSSVGESEQELRRKNYDYEVGLASYSEISRGYIRGNTHGILKILVCKRTCKLLGIHIVGDDACNLIHIGLAFMLKDGRAQDLVNMIFNYPTLAEGYRIAAFNALNKIFTDGVIRDAPSKKPPAKISKTG